MEVVDRFGIRMGDHARVIQRELASQNVERDGQAERHISLVDEAQVLRSYLRRHVGRAEWINAKLEICGGDSVAHAGSLDLDGLGDEGRVTGRNREAPYPGARLAVDSDAEHDMKSVVRTQIDAKKCAVADVGPGIVRLVAHPF